MISLNIKKGGWIITKSFTNKKELANYLNKKLNFILLKYKLDDMVEQIWNLQVSQSIGIDDFVFSIRTKQRQINPVSGVLEWK